MRKHAGQLQRQFTGFGLISLQQCGAKWARLRPRQQNQTFGELLQPRQLTHRLSALRIERPTA